MQLTDYLSPYAAIDSRNVLNILADFFGLVALPSVFFVGIFCDGFAGILTRVPTRPVVFQLLLAMLQTRTETAWTVNARPDIKVQ